MFSKKIAGMGAVVALVGSALVPSVALAAPDPTPAPSVAEANVKVTKNVTVNDDITASSDRFAFKAEPVTLDPTIDADNPGGENGFKSHSIPLTIKKNSANLAPGDTSDAILPTGADMSVFGGVPGIYEWNISEDESASSVNTAHTVRYDKSVYRLKAYVGFDNSGALVYKGITIVQTTGPKGTAVDAAGEPLPKKVSAMTFNNVYEDVPDNPGDDPDDPSDDVYGFKLTKHVVNPDGVTESKSYAINVTFGWPTNFNGTTWTTNTPTIATSSGTCTPDTTAKKTVCAVTLTSSTDAGDNDKFATFTGVPVGATYQVDEPNPGTGVTADYGAIANNGTETVPAGGASVTVTNTYSGITPTGIMLAVLPYVLMIGIPLLAIAGYIALRRKMNL